MIRFIHAADLHLGIRITRFEEKVCKRIGEARFISLDNLRVKAAEHHAHFILIAGDLFDDHSVPREDSARVLKIMEGSHMPCPVYIIPGNHDPLTAGGVWDRPPWTSEPLPRRAHVLREQKPVTFEVGGQSVTLFPCPLRHRKGIDDPTKWIAQHPRGPDDSSFRIAVAHGSLQILPNLPLDDHLIDRDLAETLVLDYVALGHWHKPLLHPSRDGVVRTAYCGTHEPLCFVSGGAAIWAGWTSFSGDSEDERFADAGRGTALLVTIESPGAAPTIEELDVGRLRWVAERHDVHSSKDVGMVISRLSREPDADRVLLQLSINGVLDPEAFERIGTELSTIVYQRYHDGSNLRSSGVMIEPNAVQMQECVGKGVLSRVLKRLQEESLSPNDAKRRVAGHALKLLYQYAREAQQA